MARIGIISPYPAFSEQVRQIAAEQGVEVEVVHAVLENAVQVAQRWEAEQKVQAVVARGLTAKLIKQRLTRLPVVTLEITGYDVMKALFSARQQGARISFIDYDDPVKPYDLGEIRAMLGFDFTPLFYDSRMGILRRLAEALRSGAEVLVSTGMIAQDGAGKRSIPAIMVESSRTAIRGALHQAMAELHQSRRVEYRDKRAQALLENIREGIIVINYRGRVTIFNPAAERLLGIPFSEVIHKQAAALSFPAFAAIYGGARESSGEMQVFEGRQFVISRIPIQVGGEPSGLVITFQSVNAIIRLEQKIRRELHTKGLTARFSFADLIGHSEAIRGAVAKAEKFARSDLTVLITGESGTGKELFAHAIHQRSPRSEGPFVAVNCAALPENLLESELFGYEEGAFTGAKKGGKPGLFELSHNGTIFLDEIGELSVPLQARLLRVLQTQEVMRVGGDRIIPVNIRVVAATNRLLSRAVQEGRFREDLYFRLDVLNLHVPPLRERPEDIPLLAEHLLRESDQLLYRPVPNEACLAALKAHNWPGNVRELRNFLLKFLILVDGDPAPERLFLRMLQEERRRRRPEAEVTVGGLAEVAASAPPLPDEEQLLIRIDTMAEMEQQILRQLDRRLDRGELARLLGISRTTLWKRLRGEVRPHQN